MTTAEQAVIEDREMESTGVDKLVAEALARNDERRKRIVELNDTVVTARKAIADSKTNADLALCDWLAGWFYVDIKIDGTSLADATPVRRALRKAGWRIPSHKKKPDECPVTNTITWEYNDAKCHEIHVALHLNTTVIADPEEDSKPTQICRYVQVGTRTREEPIYELQCEDAPAPAPEAEPSEAPEPITVHPVDDDLPF